MVNRTINSSSPHTLGKKNNTLYTYIHKPPNAVFGFHHSKIFIYLLRSITRLEGHAVPYRLGTWMNLECAHGLACLTSLWQYCLPGFSSAPGGLSSSFNDSTLGDCLPFSWGELGSWAKAHHFLFTPTFLWFPVFPLLLGPPPPTI